MLVRAEDKSGAGDTAAELGPATATATDTAKATAKTISYVEADALQLPFADASFELVTAAFGFRNLANYQAGLEEIFRVLRPGGEVGILEFAEPAGALFGPLYRFYFRHVLPRVGGVISGRSSAYSYLPASVAKFPAPDALAAMMTETGFAAASYKSWTGGTVTLHRGRKP
jgi:demethylmenaquinone methyltransferase/2-methoxy-6-polyprenyl-1,4-benzoquinol methylase